MWLKSELTYACNAESITSELCVVCFQLRIAILLALSSLSNIPAASRGVVSFLPVTRLMSSMSIPSNAIVPSLLDKGICTTLADVASRSRKELPPKLSLRFSLLVLACASSTSFLIAFLTSRAFSFSNALKRCMYVY